MSPVDRLASMPERLILAVISLAGAVGFVLLAIGRHLTRTTTP